MEKPAPIWKVIAGGLVYFAIALGPLLWFAPQILYPLGPVIVILAIAGSPFAGALVIWKIIRTLNERDDPQHARRPSDPP